MKMKSRIVWELGLQSKLRDLHEGWFNLLRIQEVCVICT
jgi:hypothetical protein